MQNRWIRRCGTALTGIVVLASSAGAQQVSGHVVDEDAGVAIATVTITALDPGGVERAVTYSDSAGWFAMRLPAGTYTLRLSRLGYADLTTEAIRLARRDEVVVELRMGPRALAVAPIVVRSRTRTAPLPAEIFRQRMARQRALGHGRFITREDIAATSVRSVNELLARDPSIVLHPLTRPGGRSMMSTIDVLLIRDAGRVCFPALFIDGVRVLRNEETDVSALFEPDALEGVEIYPRAAFAPPEFADPNGCGSVALWSRRNAGSRITLRQALIAAGFVAGAAIMMR